MDEEIIIRYLQGECTADEETLLLKWLQQSEENRELFYQTKALWNYRKVKCFGTEEQLNKATAALNQRINGIESKRKKKVNFGFVKYAAILLLALSISMLMWTSYNYFHGGTDLITVQVAQTDSSKLVTLSDGSKVWLNSNSSITYPAKFSKDERKVTFSGEAYFEVRHDSLTPFKVQTTNVQVKVLGTSFNLRAYPAERKTETTLVKGRVIIQNKHGDNLAILAPGEMAQFDGTSHALSVKKVNANQYTLWRYGVLAFTNATLTNITEKLSELYQVHFVINTSNHDSTAYNFSFKKGQPIDKVMGMLCFIAPLNYDRNGNEIVITSK